MLIATLSKLFKKKIIISGFWTISPLVLVIIVSLFLSFSVFIFSLTLAFLVVLYRRNQQHRAGFDIWTLSKYIGVSIIIVMVVTLGLHKFYLWQEQRAIANIFIPYGEALYSSSKYQGGAFPNEPTTHIVFTLENASHDTSNIIKFYSSRISEGYTAVRNHISSIPCIDSYWFTNQLCPKILIKGEWGIGDRVPENEYWIIVHHYGNSNSKLFNESLDLLKFIFN